MIRHRFLLALTAIMLLGVPVLAMEPSEAPADSAETFLASLHFQKGRVELPDGIAALEVPENFRYIGPEDSRRFLEEGWGNPNGSGQIGMLLPMDTNLFGDQGWAVVISYQEDGHVSDKDAHAIDYDEMLVTMQASAEAGNATRGEQGFEPVTLIGWATPPYYDSQAKKLYWAKELRFGASPEHTLNYNVRILGRKGVLVLNAVSGMTQLPLIEASMEQVIAFTNFKEGHRYADFDPGVDQVAAYGLAALVGGKMAAKAGLLAKLSGLLVAFKKVIPIVVIAAGGLLARLFRRRKPRPAV